MIAVQVWLLNQGPTSPNVDVANVLQMGRGCRHFLLDMLANEASRMLKQYLGKLKHYAGAEAWKSDSVWQLIDVAAKDRKHGRTEAMKKYVQFRYDETWRAAQEIVERWDTPRRIVPSPHAATGMEWYVAADEAGVIPKIPDIRRWEVEIDGAEDTPSVQSRVKSFELKGNSGGADSGRAARSLEKQRAGCYVPSVTLDGKKL